MNAVIEPTIGGGETSADNARQIIALTALPSTSPSTDFVALSR